MTFTKTEIKLCKQISKYYHRLPDWSWQDCREFLKGRGWYIGTLNEWDADGDNPSDEISIQFGHISLDDNIEEEGKTDLEAILRCVLSVLKKEKGE